MRTSMVAPGVASESAIVPSISAVVPERRRIHRRVNVIRIAAAVAAPILRRSPFADHEDSGEGKRRGSKNFRAHD